MKKFKWINHSLYKKNKKIDLSFLYKDNIFFIYYFLKIKHKLKKTNVLAIIFYYSL